MWTKITAPILFRFKFASNPKPRMPPKGKGDSTADYWAIKWGEGKRESGWWHYGGNAPLDSSPLSPKKYAFVGDWWEIFIIIIQPSSLRSLGLSAQRGKSSKITPVRRIQGLRGLNVEEVGGRRESQRATPKRAVRICLRSELAKKGCHIDDI